MISPSKKEELRGRLKSLGIKEDDIEEKFLRPGSKGGQKADKTSCAVQLNHKPSGITVKCARARSRDDNRFFARRTLADRLEEKEKGRSASSDKAAKIRKQKDRRRRRNI